MTPISTMMAALTLVQVPAGQTAGKAVNLAHVFSKGERSFYQVRSSLTAETRGPVITTAFPADLDINYDFTIEIQSIKADGVAVAHYMRPTVNVVEGETFEGPPKTKIEKTNYDLLIDISPINEILSIKDLAKAKKKPTVGAAGDRAINDLLRTRRQDSVSKKIGQFIAEMERLALFTGSFDSALDLSPKLPFNSVRPGDTWKRTVGYQPQKMKANKSKTEVQRLDYAYTYRGPTVQDGKKFERVTAELNLDTDLADFVNGNFGVTAEDTGLKKLPLKLKATITFDLDPVSHRTVQAEAESQGGFSIVVNGYDGVAVESKLKGHTTMTLANHVQGTK